MKWNIKRSELTRAHRSLQRKGFKIIKGFALITNQTLHEIKPNRNLSSLFILSGVVN